MRASVLGLLAVSAITLACVGLYGTLSYLANIRSREVGLRLALGARPGQILSQFLRQGMLVAAAACVSGLAASMAVTRWFSSMLVGVTAMDPLALGATAGVVMLVAAAASLIPAVRASRVEAAAVLRQE